MRGDSTVNPLTTNELLSDFSLEMTGKDLTDLKSAVPLIPVGTRINVTYLGNEDPRLRLDTARSLVAGGFVPVPHISARRLTSRADFESYLSALQDVGASQNVFAVGGDPSTPAGPYEDADALIRTGLLPDYGVQSVGIAGYPEGHPDIDDARLWDALIKKTESLSAQGLEASITTQFGFDDKPVLAWIEKVRSAGIHIPIRVGLPGPAGIRRLLRFANRFGVGANAMIVKKYGFSLTNLMGTAGPDKFAHALADGYNPETHGSVQLHFYTFGGLAATSEWIREFQARNGLASTPGTGQK
jgi:methylenetetrahydrofolate reductase (NADPH)